MTDERKKLQDHMEKNGGGKVVGHVNGAAVYSNGTSEPEKCVAFEIMRYVNKQHQAGYKKLDILIMITKDLEFVKAFFDLYAMVMTYDVDTPRTAMVMVHEKTMSIK